MESDSEDIVELEVRFEGLGEAVTSVLANFLKRIRALEEKVENNDEKLQDAKESLSCLKKRFDSLKTLSFNEIYDAGPSQSTAQIGRVLKSKRDGSFGNSPPPKKKRVSRQTIPVSISDLDPELQNQIMRSEVKISRDPKSKLTEAQNAYIAFWFKNRSQHSVVTGKTADVMDLESDAINHKIWYSGWQPTDIRNDLTSFLRDKLKGLHRKDRKEKN